MRNKPFDDNYLNLTNEELQERWNREQEELEEQKNDLNQWELHEYIEMTGEKLR